MSKELTGFMKIIATMIVILSSALSSFATTKGLSQIVTPDLQAEGDLSLSLQIQDKRIANPYELQAEMGLTKWAEVAVFRGFQPDEWIFGTEIGLLTKGPFLLSIGFVNWSPHLDVDPQPYIEAGYYTEHNKVIVGAIHAGYKNEAILGYAYDFNERWRVQVDFQSGSENSSTIGFTCNVTPDFQFNPALYVNNGPKHDLFGYIVFTYTFHLWGNKSEEKRRTAAGIFKKIVLRILACRQKLAAMKSCTTARSCVAVFVFAAFLWALALSASPQLHQRVHPDANRAEHNCAATMIASGSYDHAAHAALVSAPVPTLQFSKIPALTPCWVQSPFLGACIFEHAPPARG